VGWKGIYVYDEQNRESATAEGVNKKRGGNVMSEGNRIEYGTCKCKYGNVV